MLGLRRTFQNYIVRPFEREAIIARGVLEASLCVTFFAIPTIGSLVLTATLAKAGADLTRVGILSAGLTIALIIALVQLANTLGVARKSYT